MRIPNMSSRETISYNSLSLEDLQALARKGRRQQNEELAAYIRQLMGRGHRVVKDVRRARENNSRTNAGMAGDCVECV